MTNLFTRIVTGVLGIAAILLLLWIGGWFFGIAVAVLAGVGLWECYHLSVATGTHPNRVLGMIWMLSGISALILLTVNGNVALFSKAIMVIVTLLFVGPAIVLVAEVIRNKQGALVNVSHTVFGVAYIGAGMASLIMLRNVAYLDLPRPAGPELLLLLFLGVWTCDTAAYFAGIVIGRHKIWPRVSPNKSWEGSIAGLFSCVFVFALAGSYLVPALTLPMAVGGGILIGVAGQLGDFAESWLKRDSGIKDSGSLIPGHGGVMDRFDSILFAGPVFLLYLMFVSN